MILNDYIKGIKMNIEMLKTDNYQLSMAYAFIMLGKGNVVSGYEGFVRHIKAEINPNKNYMIFDGEDEVNEFMSKVRVSLENGEILEAFIKMLDGKVDGENWENEFRGKFKELDTDFEYNIVSNGSYVLPYIPVFQFKGPKWLGQIFETYVTNIYNGKTGLKTIKRMKELGLKDISKIDIDYIESIVNQNITTREEENYVNRYLEDLNLTAKEFREAAKDKTIFEAGFRRAPGYKSAYMASSIALKNGWDGTSNTSLFGYVDNSKIGGTMAHSFVMSYENEIDAFRDWNKIFKKSKILVDTYDTIKAVKKLILNNEDISNYDLEIENFSQRSDELKPTETRIDSGDFFVIVQEVRDLLDSAGWNDVKIFISGDITPDLIIKLKEANVPFDSCMAGTKYVYPNSIIKQCNSGFVYKLVQYEKDGKKFYPEKKSENKSNYPGLKYIEKRDDNEFVVYTNTNKEMDISAIEEFNENSMIIFDYNGDSCNC